VSKTANPTTIGLFVVIGLALAVAGIVMFGSGKWFRQTEQFIIYFDGSVRGLNPGSAVLVQGVKVGTVKEVLIHFNQHDGDVFKPVIIDIDQELLNSKTDTRFLLSDETLLEELVEKGLRARLQAESLVTGLLYVDLSVLPDPPPATYHQAKQIYQEIPSAPNEIQMLIDNLAQMDIKSLSEKLDAVLVTLDESLGQLQMLEISHGLTNLLASLNKVVGSSQLTNSLATLDQTLEEMRLLMESLRARVDPLAGGAEETLAEARTTLVELRLAVDDLRGLLAPDAPLKRDLPAALDRISQAARSIGDLADYLSRNPNALLSGRERQAPHP
jgi:paraquat-inducible protein B